MLTVPLTRGLTCTVDDEDRWVLDYPWYAHVTKQGKVYAATGGSKNRPFMYMHRALMDAPKGVLVDHKDGNTLNNSRKGNLRLATSSLNRQNVAGAHRDSSTGVLGVCRAKGKYQAQIGVGGKQLHLGVFPTLAEAEAARLKAEKEHWGVQPQRETAHG